MKTLEEIVLDEFKKKGIEVTIVSNNVHGIACHIDTTEHDKKIMEEVIEEYKLKLLNAKMEKGSIKEAKVWVEFKRRVIEIAEQLKEK